MTNIPASSEQFSPSAAAKDSSGDSADPGAVESRLCKVESDIVAIKIDVAAIRENVATKRDIAMLREEVAHATTGIIVWTTIVTFLAQMLPSVLQLFTK